MNSAGIRFVSRARFAGLTAVILLSALGQVEAGVITAISPSLTDITRAISSAVDGDLVVVPAGTATWTSTLNITKGITLQGATTITGTTSNPTVTDATIIQDNVVRSGDSQMIIRATLTPGQSFRLTGFTFKPGTLTTGANNGGVHLEGTCPSTRIDHCHFDRLYDNPLIMTPNGQIYGVIDHCVFDERHNYLTTQLTHSGLGGHDWGDGSWAESPYFGSEKFLFLEDNTFRNADGGIVNGLDCYGGARYVFRYNYLVDIPFGGHGTESTSRWRGVRVLEAYNNTCVWNLVTPKGQLRSGTLIEYNNLWTGSKSPDHAMTLSCYREYWPFKSWGGAFGNNPLDVNDTEGDGTNVPGHSPHLYASGTHTGGNGSATLTVANAGWVPGHWVGYSVTNTTQIIPTGTGAGFNPGSYIMANTSDTITFALDGSFGPIMTFNTGDGFAIYKLLIALDQPGRGKDNLLTGGTDPVTNGGVWPQQALEPCYAWGNTYNNSRQLDSFSPYPTIQVNRDFYNQAAAVGGAQTVGVGTGTLANRPATCTKGVGYWATDESKLYVASATNTWSLYYTPYTYPHPLVSGVPVPPAAPKNLKVVAGP